VRLVGFYYKEICYDARSHVTNHGHMNVKKLNKTFQSLSFGASLTSLSWYQVRCVCDMSIR